METPKGMRDFLPEQMIKREEALDKIRGTFREYGFRPLETPAIEKMDVLERKCGEEIKGQIFRVEDDLGLRFDLTVPLARVVTSGTFQRPFKRYAIGRAWRKEEPQKGRLREFWQADIDIIGTKGMEAEAELLSCASECLRRIGFKQFRIRVNNRKILSGLMNTLRIKDETALFRIIDKLDKRGESFVREELEKILKKEQVDEIFSFMLSRGRDEEKLSLASKYDKEGADELRDLLVYGKDYGLSLDIDFSLVRGLDYYTGPVFEISISKEIGSVAGGGRYDSLLSLYGQGDCATGISLGIERLMALMEKGEKQTLTTAYVAPIKEEFYSYGVEVVKELRDKGIRAEIDLNKRNLRKQLDYANALSIPFVLIVGEKEKKEKKVTLRDMKSGKESLLSIGEAIKEIKRS